MELSMDAQISIYLSNLWTSCPCQLKKLQLLLKIMWHHLKAPEQPLNGPFAETVFSNYTLLSKTSSINWRNKKVSNLIYRPASSMSSLVPSLNKLYTKLIKPVSDRQHIGLPMFSPTGRPKRIYQMTHGVLNLPRNPVLDWVFGHSLINCHVEHHLFPFLSDHMCLKVRNNKTPNQYYIISFHTVL